MYQMIELADQIRLRGGQPLDPLVIRRRTWIVHSKIATVWRNCARGRRAGEVPVPGARNGSKFSRNAA